MHLMAMKSVPVSAIRSRKKHKLGVVPPHSIEEQKMPEENKGDAGDDKSVGEVSH